MGDKKKKIHMVALVTYLNGSDDETVWFLFHQSTPLCELVNPFYPMQPALVTMQ